MNIHKLKRLFALQYPVLQTASIVDGSVTDAKLVDGSVTAAKLAQVDGLSMIPLVQFRKNDTTRSVLGAAGSNSLGIAGVPNYSLLVSSDPKQTTKTETAVVEFAIPLDYVPGAEMSLHFRCQMTGGVAVKVSQKLKVNAVYHPLSVSDVVVINDVEQDIPTDINTLIYNIATTNLKPGRLLAVQITCTLDDTDGTSESKRAEIGGALLSYKRYV